MLNRTKSILALIPAVAFLLAAPAHAQHDYRNPNGWVDWRGTGFLVGPDLFMTCDHLGNIKGVTVFFDTWKDGFQQKGWYRATIGEELWRGGGKADIALWRIHNSRDIHDVRMNRDMGDVIGFYKIDLQPPPARDAAVFFGGGSHYSELHGKVLWTNDRSIGHNAQGSPGFSGSPTFVDGRSEVAGVYWGASWGGGGRTDHSDRISYVWDDIKEFFVPPVTATISGPSGSVKSAFDVSIAFSEAVTGFEASDINVTNGSVTNLAGSGATYTATIALSKPGAVTAVVPANAAGNNRASNVYTVEADLNTTFTISLKRGLNLIHVPVKDEASVEGERSLQRSRRFVRCGVYPLLYSVCDWRRRLCRLCRHPRFFGRRGVVGSDGGDCEYAESEECFVHGRLAERYGCIEEGHQPDRSSARRVGGEGERGRSGCVRRSCFDKRFAWERSVLSCRSEHAVGCGGGRRSRLYCRCGRGRFDHIHGRSMGGS